MLRRWGCQNQRCNQRTSCSSARPPPPTSCPRRDTPPRYAAGTPSSRASTSFLRHLHKQDVYGPDKPGHDPGEVVRYDRNIVVDATLFTGLDLTDPSREEHVLRSYGYTGRAQSTPRMMLNLVGNTLP